VRRKRSEAPVLVSVDAGAQVALNVCERAAHHGQAQGEHQDADDSGREGHHQHVSPTEEVPQVSALGLPLLGTHFEAVGTQKGASQHQPH